MPVTVTEICNVGLIVIGHSPVADFATEPGEVGRVLRASYELLRDEMLSDYPWNFAMKRAALAKGAVAPTGGYFTAAFPLPADYLTLRQVGDSVNDRIEHQIELVADVRSIVCNEGAPLQIRYTARVTDTALFHPSFVQALGARIGAHCAPKLRGDLQARQLAVAELELWIRKARAADAIEQSPAVLEEDEWVLARFAGTGSRWSV